MPKGYNKADFAEAIGWIFETKEVKSRPCVFFSHKKEDKPKCKLIADYFKIGEIDYYLDELDSDLQYAAAADNAALITESIKKGIRKSTHMLVVVSSKTFSSPWVPFEVGYGHAAILDKYLDEGEKPDKLKLSILTLKDISEQPLPDFMQVGNIIRGTKSLNEYIAKISNKEEKALVNESRIFSNTNSQHPLDEVLNWRF